VVEEAESFMVLPGIVILIVNCKLTPTPLGFFFPSKKRKEKKRTRTDSWRTADRPRHCGDKDGLIIFRPHLSITDEMNKREN